MDKKSSLTFWGDGGGTAPFVSFLFLSLSLSGSIWGKQTQAQANATGTRLAAHTPTHTDKERGCACTWQQEVWRLVATERRSRHCQQRDKNMIFYSCQDQVLSQENHADLKHRLHTHTHTHSQREHRAHQLTDRINAAVCSTLTKYVWVKPRQYETMPHIVTFHHVLDTRFLSVLV